MPPKHGVEQHDDRADDDAQLDRHAEEVGEGDPGAAHLPGDIGEGDEQRADHRHDAGRLAVIPVADKVGHGELAELAQIRREQQRQQHIAAGPAHQVDRAVIAQKAMMPAMDRKEAALIQSAAVAMPLKTGCTSWPAT
jgi:hypothetical protein